MDNVGLLELVTCFIGEGSSLLEVATTERPAGGLESNHTVLRIRRKSSVSGGFREAHGL